MFNLNKSVLLILITQLILFLGSKEAVASSGSVSPNPGLLTASFFGCKYNQPFDVEYWAPMGFVASLAKVDVELSPGIQLLNGNLHWSGRADSSYDVVNRLTILISQPGLYTVSITSSATDLQDSVLATLLPCNRTLYFYAQEGVLTGDGSYERLQKRVQDSLFFPTADIQRRVKHRLDSLNLLTVSDQDSIGVFWIYHQRVLLDASPTASNWSLHYSTEQIKLIRKYHLVYLPLRSDADSLVQNDTIVNAQFIKLSPSQRYKMSNFGISQIRELLAIDQNIVNSDCKSFWPDYCERERLLAARRVMLHNHLSNMRAIVE
ncbi:MAG: hypothetical protein OEM52_06750 [bacterium]|nr:hypothetical protein [bacterium]